MEAIKQRLKSKTYWAGFIMAALTVIEAKEEIIAGLVAPEFRGYVPLLFPLVMLALREVTTTALSDK